MSLMQEFKDFAVKGNAIDLAVGVIIGSAFGKIVSSLVGDMLTPLLGTLLGGTDLSNLFITLGGGSYSSLAEARAAGAPVLAYGSFLQAILDFLIIAGTIFLMVKAINSAKRKEAAAPEAPAAPSEEIVLLREIRDGLRKP